MILTAELATFAEGLADAAAVVVQQYFRQSFDIESKGADGPVTIADREAERIMRERINATFPDHGILGEEFGTENLDAEYVWVLDPVDGTRAFVIGRPLFGTLIGLLHRGKPVLGVINIPMLADRWVGGIDLPTHFNGTPCRVRPCAALADASMAATSHTMFEGAVETAFNSIRDETALPIYGGDCHNYGLIASGWMDLSIERGLGLYDYLPIVPVIQGAGGIITDWNGGTLSLESGDHAIASGDQRVHDATVERLKGLA